MKQNRTLRQIICFGWLLQLFNLNFRYILFVCSMICNDSSSFFGGAYGDLHALFDCKKWMKRKTNVIWTKFLWCYTLGACLGTAQCTIHGFYKSSSSFAIE